jgi:hypothetical protein
VTSVDEKRSLATSIVAVGGPTLRPSPTAMLALTVDEDDDKLVEPDEDALS